MTVYECIIILYINKLVIIAVVYNMYIYKILLIPNGFTFNNIVLIWEIIN